jgi:N-methylhydantoinase A
VSSEGFADVLSLGRQEREHVYQLKQPETRPPVPDTLCLEVSTRIAADGSLLDMASDEELEELKARLQELDVESVAINLLFSFLEPQQEQRIADRLGDLWFVSCSSKILPEVREYERGMATWLNASVGPVISRYLNRLQERLPHARIAVMQSAGTTIAADQAANQANQAVRLLLSGPAGGLAAARSIAAQTENPKLMSFDMGGTSTDVALFNGEIPLTGQCRLGSWPLSIPSVDIHTIGAGGGSIARVDRAGMVMERAVPRLRLPTPIFCWAAYLKTHCWVGIYRWRFRRRNRWFQNWRKIWAVMFWKLPAVSYGWPTNTWRGH